MYVNVNTAGLTWLLIFKNLAVCGLLPDMMLFVLRSPVRVVVFCLGFLRSSIMGVHIVNSRSFKCSLDAAKDAFYRSANAIFGKIGRIAFEEVSLLCS